MPKIELKPCPFCGGQAILSKMTGGYTLNPVTITNTYYAGCGQCHIFTKNYASKIWQDEYGVVQIEVNGAMDAIDAWNRRDGENHDT